MNQRASGSQELRAGTGIPLAHADASAKSPPIRAGDAMACALQPRRMQPILNLGGSLFSVRSKSFLCGTLLALALIPLGPMSSRAEEAVPVYRITVVGRTIQAINFRDPDNDTFVDFRGTPLLAGATGKARVQRKQGALRVDLKIDEMVPATNFGDDYLTYVLWAITPEGRPTNLGEVALDGDHARLNATTSLQAFGLIVTAEPYFAVTQPSDVVVAEAVVRSGAEGRVDNVEAHYDLLKRDGNSASLSLGHTGSTPLTKNNRDLAQARIAVAIARGSGAAVHASEPFAKAQGLLRQAEGAKAGGKSSVMLARQATQTAEDARQIAVKHEAEAELDRERADAANREADARTDARQAEMRTAEALADTHEAEVRAADARADATNAVLSADIARIEAAEVVSEANRAVAQAENDKTTLRARLLQQFSVLLETRETTRGLLVNLPDVSFDVNRSTLTGEAREKLAKLAGIILSHPGLELAAEGHTDSTGSEEYNQRLSEERASSVANYLVTQGIALGADATTGFGWTRPVASNDSPEGRQLNRRVEVIVSGAVLGVTVSVLSPPLP